MDNFDAFKLDAAQSMPARNLRLRAFARTDSEKPGFLEAIYAAVLQAGRSTPDAPRTAPRVGPSADKIAPNLRLNEVVQVSGAPGTIQALQQLPQAGNSGLFTRMTGR